MVYDSHDTDTVKFRKQKLTIIFENVKHSLVHKDDSSSLQLAKKLEAQAFARSDNNRDAYTSLIDESIKRLKTQYSKSVDSSSNNNKIKKKESSLTCNQFRVALKNLIMILKRYDNSSIMSTNDENKKKGTDTGSYEEDLMSMGKYLELLVHFIYPLAHSFNNISINDNEEDNEEDETEEEDNNSHEAGMIASYANNAVKIQITQCFELWQTLKLNFHQEDENKEKDGDIDTDNSKILFHCRLMVQQIHLLVSAILRCYIPSIVLSKYPTHIAENLTSQQLMHLSEVDWN